MEDNNWYDIFIDNLSKSCKKKSLLVEELQKLLCIEKEAVYRRLRKEAMFPIHEIVKIASAWNISLDEIVEVNSGLIPFQMHPLNYLNPSEKEMQSLRKRARALECVTKIEDSEYMEVCNKLPRPIYIGSRVLYRFEIFKWAYQYSTDGSQKAFSQIIIPEKVSREFDIFIKNIKSIAHSFFILDSLIFEYFVQNIQFFNSISLITDEEKGILKEQLFLMLDYLSEIATKGCYPDTRKKVNIYISQLCINTNYSYYHTDNFNCVRVHAFGKYDIISYETAMVLRFKTWMNLKKRASIQISETNEKSRIDFFKKQSEIVSSL
jgi:hypothetical protein